MKFSGILLLLGVFSGILLSCEQDNLTSDELQNAFTGADIKRLHQEYIDRHGRDVIVEYTTLEALNATYIAYGLPTVTLEELGTTQEAYEAAQARVKQLKEGTILESRCSDPIYQYLGDMNDNGYLSSYDLVLVSRVLAGTAPSSYNSTLFGYISDYYFGDGSIDLIYDDVTIAQRVILGYPCNDLF